MSKAVIKKKKDMVIMDDNSPETFPEDSTSVGL